MQDYQESMTQRMQMAAEDGWRLSEDCQRSCRKSQHPDQQITDGQHLRRSLAGGYHGMTGSLRARLKGSTSVEEAENAIVVDHRSREWARLIRKLRWIGWKRKRIAWSRL
jgi:hypothetical protein